MPLIKRTLGRPDYPNVENCDFKLVLIAYWLTIAVAVAITLGVV